MKINKLLFGMLLLLLASCGSSRKVEKTTGASCRSGNKSHSGAAT